MYSERMYRWDKYVEDFRSKKNAQQVAGVWAKVAAEIQEKHEIPQLTVQQCKNKLEYLKKVRDDYKKKEFATGNQPTSEPPEYIEKLNEYWRDQEGLTNETLRDDITTVSDSDNDDEEEEDDENDEEDEEDEEGMDDEQKEGKKKEKKEKEKEKRKKRKTNGECLESGMVSVAEGLKCLGSFMAKTVSLSRVVALFLFVILFCYHHPRVPQTTTTALMKSKKF